MRAVTILALSAIIATAASAGTPPSDASALASYSFKDYVRDFRRTYQEGTEEYEARRAIFEAKKKAVIAHNADATASRNYKKAINDLSDASEVELKNRRGGKIHAKWQQREALRSGPRASKFAGTRAVTGAAPPVPQSVDWRNHVPSILTGIKNQGNCGSCWAHAATENLESHWALRTGQLFTLSQQEVTACAPNPNQCGGTGGCDGSIAELAYDYLASAGVAEEWSYPYTAFYGTTGTCNANVAKTIVNVTGFTAVTSNDQDAVMEAIATQGPLAINVDASTWNDYGGGIFDGCNYANNITIDHVVQLVGYGYDDGLKQSYWIVRNSWSASWGEKGFIRLIRHDKPECGWDVEPQDGTACKGSPPQLWACGQCGILYDTVFPTVSA